MKNYSVIAKNPRNCGPVCLYIFRTPQFPRSPPAAASYSSVEEEFNRFYQLKMSQRYKIVLLGEGRVGKTSILLRYIRGEYSDGQVSTLQASYLDKKITVGGSSVQLSVWDTAGIALMNNLIVAHCCFKRTREISCVGPYLL
jgi:tRNA U34 5-carboxymethylaminomethyl modifying GTPase MnmE/TrmE